MQKYSLNQHLIETLYGSGGRVPNLDMEIVKEIEKSLGMFFTPEDTSATTTVETDVFTPLDLLDYIYAVLHSPSYREKYKEFLKIDFPSVPYPTDKRKFIDLVALGGELRQIHLLESPVVEKYITQYPEDGDNVVMKPRFVIPTQEESHNEMLPNVSMTKSTEKKTGHVYINDTQYFANVPEVAWNFYIGGYQPAQKWLKDRKDRELGFEDILHYQKIIVALCETARIMEEIDKIEL